jgi:hypothetical protein
MASTAEGLIFSAGWDPAERTSTAPFDRDVRNAAAIWDRPALWTQTKRTEGFLAVSVVTLFSWIDLDDGGAVLMVAGLPPGSPMLYIDDDRYREYCPGY